MKHPEVLLVPALMFADYFLTIYGNILNAKIYKNHFASQHYELNPIFQRDVFQNKWFNLRHITLTILLTVGLIVIFEVESKIESNGYLGEGLLGGCIIFFSAVVGRHLSNILIFRYLSRHPNEISGQVKMSHAMRLSISMYQYMVIIVPMSLLAVLCPSPFVVGGFIGVIMLFLAHYDWLRQHKKKVQNPTISEPPAS